jgi:uncharacterized protein involved in high-affinity Fe2+ transport
MHSLRHSSALKTLAALSVLSAALSAQALEYPIGTPHQRFGMEIAAVYLQPVVMEPEGMMKKAEESDICVFQRSWTPVSV